MTCIRLFMRAVMASAILLACSSAGSAKDHAYVHCLRMSMSAKGKPVHFLDKTPGKKEKNAIVAWESLAREKAGALYAHWNYAADKKIECYHLNRSYMQCQASATPCLPGK